MSQKFAALLMILGGSVISSLSLPAQAQEHAPAPSTPSPAAPVNPDADNDSPDAGDLTDSDLELAHYSGELGLGMRKGLGLELRFNWYKDEDLVLGVKVGQYSAKNIANFDNMSLTSLTLISRFNVEGSFFFEGGIDYTQIKAKIDSSDLMSLSGAGTYAFDGSVNQSYLMLSFGNQWQSGDWTFGADWIDLYLPFTGSSAVTDSKGSIADRESRERQDKRELKTETWAINYGISVHAGMLF